LPYQLTLFTNNYRPPSIGAEAGGVNAWARNLTGFGDVLDFNFQGSGGSQLYSGGFAMPILSSGTQAYFHFTQGDSSVIEAPTDQLDIQSQVHHLEGGLSHPIINSLKRKLTLGTSFAVRENETTLLGRDFSFNQGQETGHSQVSVLRFFQEHIERMEDQVLALRSTFSVGLNVLSATPRIDSKNPSGEFFAWLGQSQYAYRVLENGAQIVLRGNVQVTGDALLPLERMAVGGVNTVRGYRENELVRDEGFTSSLEFHYPILGGESEAKHSLTILPFMDYGGGWNQEV
jgi:hemolysin activation/secretion protein